MEILVVVTFEWQNSQPDIYNINFVQRIYRLERENGQLIWTLHNKMVPKKITEIAPSLPILVRDIACLGADLIYDQVEFERAFTRLQPNDEGVPS